MEYTECTKKILPNNIDYLNHKEMIYSIYSIYSNTIMRLNFRQSRAQDILVSHTFHIVSFNWE